MWLKSHIDVLLTHMKNGLKRLPPEDRIGNRSAYPDVLQSMKRLFPYVRLHWKDGMLGAGLALLGGFFLLPQPMITRFIVDDAILERRAGLLVGAIILLAFVAAAGKFAEFLEPFYSKKFEQDVTLDLQKDLLGRTLSLPKRFFDEHQTGYLMSRLTTDIEEVRWFFSGTIVQIISNVIRLIGGLLLLFYLEWRLAAAVILILPGIAFGVILFSRKIHALSHHMLEKGASVRGELQESLGALSLVKSFAAENRSVSRLLRLLRAENRTYLEGTAIDSLASLSVSALPAIARLGVLAIGAFLVITDRWSLGSLLAFQLYLGYVFHPLQSLASINMDLQRALAALQRVFSLFEVAVEENIGEGHPVHHLEGMVEFKNVFFSYNGEPVIEDLSFVIEPGRHAVIVGPSGIGKTTLLSLILRFYKPVSGEVLFDGMPADTLEVRSLRRRIGYLSQQPQILSGTIMENLVYGNEGAGLQEIETAVKTADMGRFIQSLPDGYDTIVGEIGINLSEGQKQRIALARALIRDPDILILDEPTAAVDHMTEKNIIESLRSTVGNKTLFIVTHRPSVFKNADRILLFDENRLVALGNHESLSAGNAYYQSLVEDPSLVVETSD